MLLHRTTIRWRPPRLRTWPPPQRPPRPPHRAYGKRITTQTLDLSQLPQGALPPLRPSTTHMAPEKPATPQYPPVLLQALTTMSSLPPGTALLTRVGGFYELYFSDALALAPVLGIKLATRRTAAGPVPMAGFPVSQVEKYLGILVTDGGRNVAVAEEFALGAKGGAGWERRVARIVTPGTMVAEEESRFLLAAAVPDAAAAAVAARKEEQDDDVGLAWCDLGTGETWCAARSRAEVRDEVARVGPSEVVVAAGVGTALGLDSVSGWTVSEFEPPAAAAAAAEPPSGWGDLTRAEQAAGANLLAYIRARLPETSLALQPPTRRARERTVRLDVATMRGLELVRTIRDGGRRGSLVHAVDRTATPGGRRLLQQRIVAPSTEKDVIERRLDVVEALLADETLRSEVGVWLKRSFDSRRIVQKFTMGRGDAEDLLALARTVEVCEGLRKSLGRSKKAGEALGEIRNLLKPPRGLAAKISNAIDEEGLQRKQREDSDKQEEAAAAAAAATTAEAEAEAAAFEIKPKKGKRLVKEIDKDRGEAWVMKKDASQVLGALHNRLEQLEKEKQALQERLREQLGSQLLTLRWSPGLGHICHVKGKAMAHVLSLLPTTQSVSSSRSTHSFHHPLWTHLGQSLDAVALEIRAAEAAVFTTLRYLVLHHLATLRTNAAALDALDVALSSSLLALEQALTRPLLVAATTLHIVHGRHPTVAPALTAAGRRFTPNSTTLGPPTPAHVITGPNMAGKSTYLRQVALITLLAQTGAFVPAAHATVGIVDAIFSRVGAADDIHAGRSTYMCEMLEVAAILRSSTARSLVVVDEVGRGTAPGEGATVAWAVLWGLVCGDPGKGQGQSLGLGLGLGLGVGVGVGRVLFATHFQNVVDLAKRRLGSNVAFWCTDLRVDGDGAWTFEHRLREGVNRNSHAVRVARMAGVPGWVLDEAERVRADYVEKEEEKEEGWGETWRD